MSAAAERKNQQIWDALEANNLKQALQLCAKRFKKGEKGDYLRALRTYILTQGSSAPQRQDGFADAKSLIEKEPAITDFHTLSLICKSLENLEVHEQSTLESRRTREYETLLWERALKANPKDENLGRECFFWYLRQQDWKNAQKTAMFLQRTFNKKRDYYFWAVLCCHLLYMTPDTSEAEQRLFGALAYRMISKAASEVLDDSKAVLSPARAIQTPQELHLLITIYSSQGYESEALAILDSSHLGIESPIAKGGWSFVRQKLEILEGQTRWEDIWCFCKQLLRNACFTPNHDSEISASSNQTNNHDDWRVWQAFIAAKNKINKPEFSKETEELVESHFVKTQASRNAQLARLRNYTSENSGEAQEKRASGLLFACRQHFEAAATKRCCYDDLRECIHALEVEDRQSFLDFTNETSEGIRVINQPDKKARALWIAAKTNSLKVQFQISISQQNRLAPKQDIILFINSSLQLYKESLSGWAAPSPDDQPGEDACSMAVMALVHLSRSEDGVERHRTSIKRLLQAATLLEILNAHSENNYQARLILVRVYTLLGCGSLAFKTYQGLNIKQVQNDTLSHNIFTRISTIHPWSFTNLVNGPAGKAGQEPMLGLQHAMKTYKRSEDQVPLMAKLAVEQGSYDQVAGFLDLGQRLSSSVCKYMWGIESRRVARLLGGKAPAIRDSDAYGPILPPSPISDNRDDEVITSFEGSGQPRFEEYIRVGPKPRSTWVKAFGIVDKLLAELSKGESRDGEFPSAFIDGLLTSAQQLKLIIKSDASDQELTDSESSYLDFFACMADMVTDSMGDVAGKKTCDANVSEARDGWLRKKIDEMQKMHGPDKSACTRSDHDSKYPSWETLHDAFMTLDAMKIAISMLRFKAPRGKSTDAKVSKAAVSNTKELVMSVHQEVRSRIARIKNEISEEATNKSLVDLILEKTGQNEAPIGAAFQGLVDEPWAEAFVCKIAGSWQEALDGVLNVKIG